MPQKSIILLDPTVHRARRVVKNAPMRLPRYLRRRHSVTGSILHDRSLFEAAIKHGPALVANITRPTPIDPLLLGHTTALLLRMAEAGLGGGDGPSATNHNKAKRRAPLRLLPTRQGGAMQGGAIGASAVVNSRHRHKLTGDSSAGLAAGGAGKCGMEHLDLRFPCWGV
jgi:hypothetical protein